MHARAKSGSEIELHMSFSIDSTVCIYRSTSGFALSTSEKEGRIVGIAMVKWPSVMALLSGTCGERETFGQDRCHLWRGMSTRTCAVPHLDAEAPHARSVLNGHPVTLQIDAMSANTHLNRSWRHLGAYTCTRFSEYVCTLALRNLL